MELATRVSKLELLTQKLGQSSLLVNEVLTDLTAGLSTTVREQVKEEMATCKREIESNVLVTVSNAIDNAVDYMDEKCEKTVKDTVKEAFDERGLSKHDADTLTRARAKRMRELLGDTKSDKYVLFIKYYQGRFKTKYYKHFKVNRFADIKPDQYLEAMEFTKRFVVSDVYKSWCIDTLHKEYRANEIENNKKKHAYERYFGLTEE